MSQRHEFDITDRARSRRGRDLYQTPLTPPERRDNDLGVVVSSGWRRLGQKRISTANTPKCSSKAAGTAMQLKHRVVSLQLHPPPSPVLFSNLTVACARPNVCWPSQQVRYTQMFETFVVCEQCHNFHPSSGPPRVTPPSGGNPLESRRRIFPSPPSAPGSVVFLLPPPPPLMLPEPPSGEVTGIHNNTQATEP